MSERQGWTAPGPSSPGGDGPYGPPPAHGPPPPGPAYEPAPPLQLGPGAPRLEYRPGIIPLRPITMSEVWSGVIGAIRGNPGATIGLALLTTSVVLLPFTALGVWVSGQHLTVDDPLARQALSPFAGPAGFAALLGSYVPLLATYFTALLLPLFMALVVGYGIRGRKVGLGETWLLTRGRILTGLGTMLLIFAIFVGLFIAVAVIPVVLWASDSGSAAGISTVIAIVVGTVGAVHLWVRLGFATSIVVLEHAGAWRSVGRSWQLTKGARPFWRLFGIRLLTSFIASVAGSVISMPVTFVGTYIVGGSTATDSVAWLLPVSQAIAVLVQAVITTPFVSGVDSLLYVDQRIRREGLDVQLIQQLSSSPVP